MLRVPSKMIIICNHFEYIKIDKVAGHSNFNQYHDNGTDSFSAWMHSYYLEIERNYLISFMIKEKM